MTSLPPLRPPVAASLPRAPTTAAAGGRLGDRDEITIDQFRDVCARLDVALSGRELELVKTNFVRRRRRRRRSWHSIAGGRMF